MVSCDEILERASKDGSIDVVDWAHNFDEALHRLHHNVHNVFPIPSIPKSPPPLPPPATAPSPAVTTTPSKPISSANADPSSQTSNNGDTLPNTPTPSVSQQTSQLPPPPATLATSLSNSQSQDQSSPLPPHLLLTWNYVQATLKEQFSKYPPHTIQRLAELVLHPTRHYRLLHSYLNALDRVVSVSSGSHVFPLPAIELASQASSTLVNGAAPPPIPNLSTNLNSDESLGGALLTPIPWLRNVADSSGPGSETSSPTASVVSSRFEGGIDPRAQALLQPGPATSASDTDPGDMMVSEDAEMSASPASTSSSTLSGTSGAVTQGELLRREQEASSPPTPVASAGNRDHVLALHASNVASAPDTSPPLVEAVGEELDETHGRPHARGPEEIGLADTGNPQAATAGDSSESHMVLDMEAAVGRSSVESSHKSPPAQPVLSSASTSSTPPRDSDGDIPIADVDHDGNEGFAREDVDVDGMAADAPSEVVYSKQMTRAAVAREKEGT